MKRVAGSRSVLSARAGLACGGGVDGGFTVVSVPWVSEHGYSECAENRLARTHLIV